jgi:alanine dehydrogenase
MYIGVPNEIKNSENRVGLTPGSVRELTRSGHQLLVQTGAGQGINEPDAAYEAAGATLIPSAAEVFASAEMIVKVKEPQPEECARLREGQILFTFLHLAPDVTQTEALLRSRAVAIAYETVTDENGRLPLLAPMSEVAGRMSIHVGAYHLHKHGGGHGVLLGGVTGVPPAKVVIVGGGTAGTNAARMAVGLGARVIVLDRSLPRLAEVDMLFGSQIETVYSTRDALEREIVDADLIVGAVLVPGAAAPKLIDRELLSRMRKGSVIVDVAIDQGGMCETSHPTTHDDPIFVVEGVVHYCVANMPGAVPRTSTFALNNATLPFVHALADKGWRRAVLEDPHLRRGLNIAYGELVEPAVAGAQDRTLGAIDRLIA